MTKKEKIAKKLQLSLTDFTSIRLEVQEAEMRTNGEIAVAAIAESSSYSFKELLASCIAGAFVFTLLTAFRIPFKGFLEQLFWVISDFELLYSIGAISFGTIALFFAFSNMPCIDRLLLSDKEMNEAVNNRAIRHFVESGVYSTENRTGILIFISLLEHRVQIIADTGICEKIQQERWNELADTLAQGIKSKNASTALCETIEECGKLLAEFFPVTEDDTNELPDGLVLLES